MRIIFAGTPEFAVPSLRALVAHGHQVAGVITREDAPLGRKRVLTPSPVAAAAEELGLPVHKANRLDDTALAWAEDLDAELGVIVAYGGLVREPLLSLPTLGWINLHFSDLPRWRGAAPVQRALAAGEQTLSVTAFRLVAALDAGDVLSRDSHEFAPGTSAGAALTYLSELGTGALLKAIDALAADPAAGEPQVGDTTYAHKLTREDGKLDLCRGAAEVLAQWAGMTPEPGAYALHEDAPLKLHELREVQQDAAAIDPAGDAGSVTLADGRVLLQLSDGQLEVVRVQPAGKPAMAAADWLRGRGGNVVLS